MKIIKKGKKIIETMEVTCHKCSAILEVEPIDLTLELGKMYSFKCPCCNRRNELSEEQLTKDFLFAKKRKR